MKITIEVDLVDIGELRETLDYELRYNEDSPEILNRYFMRLKEAIKNEVLLNRLRNA